jgi:hypothetical protein
MAEEQEQEIIVETEEELQAESQEAPEEVKEPAQEPAESELDSYSKGVQSRIKKLTEKYRQEERDKSEAVRLSQQLIDENKKLKSRVQSLDSGYLNEYGNRLESQTLSAKQLYKEAHESGDTDKMLEAQELISKIAVEKQRYASAKTKAEQQAKLEVQRQQQPPQQQPPQQQPPQQPQQQAAPDPKAQAWAGNNKWFGEDRVMTMAAFAINQQLIDEEGFDPQSDEYYTAIDSRIRREFPHKFESPKKSGGGSQVASAGNSASRSTKTGRRSVKLSHSAVAIAKKLGVPLEEYAKYVKD